jgi:lipoprotein-releasing system permease protein
VYKFLLCARYLRTRYLAAICIVSVMLGVATLIVVNSVMSGFSTKLKDRLHGVLSDVVIDTERFSGFAEKPEAMMRRIAASPAGKHVEAMAPTVEVVGTIHIRFKGYSVVKPVKIIGVDPERQSRVGQFREYLVRGKDEAGKDIPMPPSFDLTPNAIRRFEENRMFDPIRGPRAAAEATPAAAGVDFLRAPQVGDPLGPPPAIPAPELPPTAPPRLTGVIVGYSLAHFRFENPETKQIETVCALPEGADVFLATLGANVEKPEDMRPVYGTYLVTGYFKSEMSEYDSQFVYMPIDELQKLRGMDGRATHIQIKLKDGSNPDYQTVKREVTPPIQRLFSPYDARVLTWQDHQGPLLAAIDIERGILNLLLFMIIGVAGFSILAIFTMIVSEKYRDIGILKSLGASSRGVMGIFVWYAVLLGVVGCVLGSGLGLWITHNINEIEAFLTRVTGHQVFDRSVYYFDKIPTQIEPGGVALINAGAMLVAVVSSLLPAMRAARLQPIRALRFE